MRRSKRFSAVSMLAVSALALSACGAEDGDDGGNGATALPGLEGKAQEGGVFKLADVPAWDTKLTVAIDAPYTAYNNDELNANTSYNNYVLVAVQAGVHIFDGNNKVVLNGDVMESAEATSDDPQTVEWNIKPGVKWSDGEAWDCDDFYLAYLAHSGVVKGFTPAATNGYEQIGEVECVDDTTFKAVFAEPFPDWRNLFNTGIVPAHILEQGTGVDDITKVGKDADAATVKKVTKFWNEKWRGFDADIMPASGPYKISAWNENAQIVTLERNTEFAGAKGGPKTIVVRSYPDTKAAATALANGEIDVFAGTQPDATAATTLKGLESQGVVYASAPQLTYEHLDLNYKRIFADKAARQAFFAALDRKEIAQKLMSEVQPDVKPLNSIMFLPNDEGYTDNYSDKLEQGAEAAAKILEDGGWVKGSDGIYAKDGKRFSVEIKHNENDRRSKTVEIIQAQLKNAGIEVADKTDPAFFDGALQAGDWDVALFGWSQEPFKSSSKSIYISAKAGGDQNFQGLASDGIDRDFPAAVKELDEAKAIELYQAIDKALAEEYATVPIYSLPSMFAYRGIDQVFMQSYFGALWTAGEWENAG